MIEHSGKRGNSMVLHDNTEDPYQRKNRAGSQPGIVEELVRNELLPWLEKAEDPWRI